MKSSLVPKIEIIAVGSELLSPFFQDTNSLYLIKRLNDLGLEAHFKTTVGDDLDDLLLAIRNSLARSSIVFIMGGLGPTNDDRTREALSSALKRKLLFQEEVFEQIHQRFQHRGISMPSVNKKQAYQIEGSELLDNQKGTAPGIWMETSSNIIISLPGPPTELKAMFELKVWPRLLKFQRIYSVRKTIKITGFTESKVESLIQNDYPKDKDSRLTILSRPGQIEIHLLSQSQKDSAHAEKNMEALSSVLLNKLGKNIFSVSGESLEEIIGDMLKKRQKTVAAAESCTGGYLGHRLTDVPGSSDYFLLSIVAYQNDQKIRLLYVPQDLLVKYGAVSSEVACAMAVGIRKRSSADYGLAITGIAGPGGSSVDKPVGLVYTALAGPTHTEVKKNLFLGNRETIKFQSSQKMLDMLRRHLMQSP
ncbi:MAG: competence/damage-inducible protein A [Candidatus Aminicenantes bacterium]|nr:competence/damage-inducible protein A [Candidatus Aminicenantes bacterium]